MADVKISGLPASTVPLDGTEVLPIVQGSTTKQVSITNVTAGRVIAASGITTDTYKAASSAGGTLQSNNGTACLQWGAGGGSNVILDGGVSLTAANVAATFSPTGTGTVTISPTGALTINPVAASTINNTSIGATTASTGKFSAVTNTALTSGRVTYASTSGLLADSAGLTFDGTNLTLGTSNGGIIFNNSSALANSTLNDYEIGTWFPNQGSGLTLVGAFGSSGKYTKVGSLVTVAGIVSGAISVALASNGVLCTNLPFTSTAGNYYSGTLFNNNAAISIIYAGLSGTDVNNTIGAVAASTTIFFSITYRASF
jgi:hypothetical protein